MIYFASDTHLGLRSSGIDARKMESRFVSWLAGLEDCTELYLLGDIFDYWFEYRRVVPKGYVRLFGQLARMSDNGVRIHFFAGNHDLWQIDYLENEIGIDVCCGNRVVDMNGKRVLISHGDALAGANSLIGKIFRSVFLRWLFQRLVHPDLSLRFGCWWSLHNRMSRSIDHPFKGEDEGLVRAARKVIAGRSDLDYIICGHIHVPLRYRLNEKTEMVVLGQWVVGNPVVASMDDDGDVSLLEVQSLS